MKSKLSNNICKIKSIMNRINKNGYLNKNREDRR
jgi:hypothetical protein